MKEHGIIFTAEEIRAFLEHRKSQVRRAIKIPNHGRIKPATQIRNGKIAICFDQSGLADWMLLPIPYAVGDRIWVKESWCEEYYGEPIHFKADGGESPGPKGFWRSPVTMPKRHARIWREIVGVKVEKLNSMTEDDAHAEGVDSLVTFMLSWDKVNKRRGYEWERNCWVWILELQKV